MKRWIVLIQLVWMMSSCISASSVPTPHRKRVTVVTTVPAKPRSKVVVKKVVVGSRVRVLPPKTVVIKFQKTPFIYAEGVFYRKLCSNEYEVVKPEIGMVIPELPRYNVEKVCVNGEDLFLFEGTLYKQIPTTQGVQYRVSGFLEQ